MILMILFLFFFPGQTFFSWLQNSCTSEKEVEENVEQVKEFKIECLFFFLHREVSIHRTRVLEINFFSEWSSVVIG